MASSHSLRSGVSGRRRQPFGRHPRVCDTAGILARHDTRPSGAPAVPARQPLTIDQAMVAARLRHRAELRLASHVPSSWTLSADPGITLSRWPGCVGRARGCGPRADPALAMTGVTPAAEAEQQSMVGVDRAAASRPRPASLRTPRPTLCLCHSPDSRHHEVVIRHLVANPCQDACGTVNTGQLLDGAPIYRCPGCASEWVETPSGPPDGAPCTASRQTG